MEYGQLITGDLARTVLNAAGIKPNDVPGDFYSFNYGGNVYWVIQREMYFSPNDVSVDGWHLVYKPSNDEIAGGGPGPGFWDNLEAAFQSISSALASGAKTAANISPIIILAVAGIGIFALYKYSKKATA